ncbi:hypothetical protein KY284_029212 [Solanum tuberosum]|nr:hypothetical protein KY284_029212 [Solanum tuberosum]
MTNLNIYQTHLYPFTADAAASYAEYRSELEIERKDNIRKLVGSPLAILKTLSPQVRKRVEALRNLQGQPVALKALLSEEKAVLKAGYEKVLESLHTKSDRDGLKALFSKEKAVLEAKYEKLHGSLNSKRYEIVNGVVEVKGDNMGTGDEKGVPNFWLTALKSYAKYEEEIYISKRDEEALKFLKDIKWCRVDHPKDLSQKGKYGYGRRRNMKSKCDVIFSASIHSSIIRNKIISQAVLWFTGEAKHDEDGNDYDDEDDDDDYAYDYDYEDDNNDDDNGYDYNYDDVDNNDDEYAEYYDGEDEEEEEKPEKKFQVQHRSPVTRGIGVAAAAATGGTATTAVPGGVANQFKPTSLYIGDLNINVTDTQLYQLFNQAGQVISVRICREFSTRRSLGYGFVNYSNPQDAARAMEMLDFTPVNGKSIRVKRSHRDPNSPKNRTANLFIRNLDKSIDIEALHDTFSSFGHIPSCKIVTDSNGQSKGYGFVQFDNDESAQSAIDKLNGMLINGKQVYVAHALRKEQCMCKGNYSNPQDAARAMEMLDSTPVNGKSIRVKRSHRDPNSPKNRTANLFIRNLDKSIEIESLDDTFSSFGYIPSCKIVTDSNCQSKGYGFVQFDNDESAQSAIDKLNGMLINGKQVYVAHALRKEKCMCKGNYSNPQDAARAMEMLDSTPVNGKSIRVKRSHRDPNSPKNRTANLFIRNLDKSIEIEALHDTFSCFGYIPSCKIVTDSNGQSKGYGFVQFDNDESAQSAIDKLNGMLINGKQVYVAHALCKEKSGRGTSWGRSMEW